MPQPPHDEPADPTRVRASNRLMVFGGWIMPALLAMAVILPLRSAVADWNDVPSGSMWPTILEGDRIFVDKLAYGLRLPFTTRWIREWEGPQRGDIVTFASPKDGTRLVKRIVGVPGDHIAMSGNRLEVNGETVSYRETDDGDTRTELDGHEIRMVVATESLPGCRHEVAFTPGLKARDTFAELVVPEDHYFFLGDNRDQSYDSRFVGFVERDQIYGRVTHVALSVDPEHGYWPRFDRWFTPIH